MLACVSIIGIFRLYKRGLANHFVPFYFVQDCNKILALLIGVSSFMWFKDLKIGYSAVINTIGAATFGVLLIHAHSDPMRRWLWRDTIDSVGHFSADALHTVTYALGSVLAIFLICALIDIVRAKLIDCRIGKITNKILKR